MCLSYSMSHSESTKELARPPKNGTSKRSKPSAVAMSVVMRSLERGHYTVPVGMHGKESDKCEVNDE